MNYKKYFVTKQTFITESLFFSLMVLVFFLVFSSWDKNWRQFVVHLFLKNTMKIIADAFHQDSGLFVYETCFDI